MTDTLERMIPRLDLLDPLLPHHVLASGVDWEKEFASAGELEVEIGSGMGEFITRNARLHPQKRFLGIEFDQKRIQKILGRLSLAGCSNVRLLSMDARIVFERLLNPSSVARVYCLFPDPWPKHRHIKNRLLSRDFFLAVNNRLTDGGEFKIVTDFHPYIEWILGQIKDTGFRMEVKTIPAQYETKFERKWCQTGLKEFIELSLIKEKHVSIPAKQDNPLKILSVNQFESENFSFENVIGKTSIVFKELLFDPKQKKALVRLIVTEGKFEQNVWVAIIHKHNSWSIQLAQGCPCMHTGGVKQALELVHRAVRDSDRPRKIKQQRLKTTT